MYLLVHSVISSIGIARGTICFIISALACLLAAFATSRFAAALASCIGMCNFPRKATVRVFVTDLAALIACLIVLALLFIAILVISR